jgi:hypothetical protein
MITATIERNLRSVFGYHVQCVHNVLSKLADNTMGIYLGTVTIFIWANVNRDSNFRVYDCSRIEREERTPATMFFVYSLKQAAAVN